jgi:hypothetical protein
MQKIKTLPGKKMNEAKRSDSVAQVVESLPGKCKA